MESMTIRNFRTRTLSLQYSSWAAAQLALWCCLVVLTVAVLPRAVWAAPALETKIQKLHFIIDQFTAPPEDHEPPRESSDVLEQKSYEETREEERLRRGAIPCWLLEPHYYQSGPNDLNEVWAKNQNPILQEFIDEGRADTTVLKDGTYSQFGGTKYDVYEGLRTYVPAFFTDLDVDGFVEDEIRQRESDQGHPFTDQERSQLEQELADDFNVRKSQFLQNFPDGEFVGFISFKMRRVRERYNPQKHDSWPLVAYRGRVPGTAVRRPVKHISRIHSVLENTASLSPHGMRFPSRVSIPQEVVEYEICFDPQPHLPSERMDEYPEFVRAFEGRSRFVYFEEDAPIATIYRLDTKRRTENEVRDVEQLVRRGFAPLTVVRLFVPEVNLAMVVVDAIRCENGDAACYAQAATDAALIRGAQYGGEAWVSNFFKISVGTPVSKIAPTLVKQIAALPNDALHGGLFLGGLIGEASLSVYHVRRGEYLKAVATIINTGIDFVPVSFGAGKIVAARLGKVVPDCKRTEIEFPVSDLRTQTPLLSDIDQCELPSNLARNADAKAAVKQEAGNFHNVMIHKAEGYVHKFPKPNHGDPARLSRKYVEISDAVAAADPSLPVTRYTLHEAGKSYTAPYVEGVVQDWDAYAELTPYMQRLKAVLMAKYQRVKAPSGDDVFLVGENCVALVDPFPWNFLRKDDDSIEWIDPVYIMQLDMPLAQGIDPEKVGTATTEIFDLRVLDCLKTSPIPGGRYRAGDTEPIAPQP